MAITAWPFENADTTEVQYSKLMRLFQENGVVSGLIISAGVGMQINVSAGDGVVQGFYFESTAVEPRTVTTAHATLVRRDYVLLKLDMAANTITLEIRAGTPSGTTGTLPALVQTSTIWEFPIGIITIPAAAASIVTGNIANQQSSLGLRTITYANSSARPVAPTQKCLGLDLSTNFFDYWNGTTWVSLAPAAPAWSAITGKPSTFAPSAHTHSTSEVTGLDSALTGKAPTVHSHSASQITDPANLSVGNSAKIAGATVFIQSATPTANAVNDLWFW